MITELPLTTDPSSNLTVQVGRVKYDFAIRFNDRSKVWTFDLAVSATKEVLLQSIPVVLGADLLGPYNLGMGRLIAADTTTKGLDASLEDLGSRVRLVWFSKEEG